MRFMTLEPGHFHAALVQKSMFPNVASEVDVYSRPGFDLDEHLRRIDSFNGRAERPTRWRTRLHVDPDPLTRMIAEMPGDAVILAGRNRPKIGYVLGAVENGCHVLADKPWVIREEDLPLLERALSLAEARGLVAYDIMTERFEVTNELQRELVRDPEVFGAIVAGSSDSPGVYMRSIHHIVKEVAGVPLRRPTWFFDITEQGEALADVGTHLVDHTLWTLATDSLVDVASDIRVHSASRWPTRLSRDEFAGVTGETAFPEELRAWVDGDELAFFANTAVEYSIRGVHIHLDALWDVRSSEHGDTHHAVYQGDRSRIEIRQGVLEEWRPELYVVPSRPGDRSAVLRAVGERVRELAHRWPGLGVEDRGEEIHISIPDRHRTGHEAHFGEVTSRFLDYVADPSSLPAWENPNMLAKYFITTRGTTLSLQS
jgi:predicted dehydrogenase